MVLFCPTLVPIDQFVSDVKTLRTVIRNVPKVKSSILNDPFNHSFSGIKPFCLYMYAHTHYTLHLSSSFKRTDVRQVISVKRS